MTQEKANYISSKYYFCYSWYQQEFLREKGMFWISTGLNITTKDQFYMYEKTDELQAALKAYSEKSKQSGHTAGYHSRQRN